MESLRDKILSKAKGAAIASKQLTNEESKSAFAEKERKSAEKEYSGISIKSEAVKEETLESAFLHCMGLGER